ncbi:membrane protein [Xylanibacillus composti]|uniref:Membrane protein n=1 Tax=Xylanibacillus composti TaxID=1572762 RepID=A0A8J4H4U1_9BACL|nr:DUF4184 family protein [Xylanibacillus composti]GIQ69670.1 membrane protein [Xylanibacillus composti]
MPFTFAHPVYIAPLKYVSPKYVSLTGLILGSMAPDFEYFLMLEPYRSMGHSLAGLFLQAIPLSLVLAFLFHYVVKESMAKHLPSTFQLDQRAYSLLGKWQLRSLRDWLIFISSVMIGFLSHVTLDSFTHAHGYGVMQYSWLREIVILNYPFYKLLQHSLSILGLCLTFVWIGYRLFRSEPDLKFRLPMNVSGKRKLLYWTFVLLTSIAVTIVKLAGTTSSNLTGIIVVAPISGAVLGLILVSLATKTVRRQTI